MSELPPWLPVVGVLALAALFVAFGFWREKRRTEALRGACLRLGMVFSDPPQDAELEDEQLRQLPLFQKGRSRKLRNAARGQDLWVFDYRYTVGSGKNSSVHVQTVAAFPTRAELPLAWAAPEGLFDRIGTAFGGQDIDFADSPEFSKRYRLRGQDEAAVRRVFSPGVRQELAMEPVWSMELRGRWVVVYRAGKRVSPDDIAQFATETRRIAALFS